MRLSMAYGLKDSAAIEAEILRCLKDVQRRHPQQVYTWLELEVGPHGCLRNKENAGGVDLPELADRFLTPAYWRDLADRDPNLTIAANVILDRLSEKNEPSTQGVSS